jgi:hypothetical protein
VTSYVPRHFSYLDAGLRIVCDMCGADAPLADDPDVATWDQGVFIDQHTSCGGDA